MSVRADVVIVGGGLGGVAAALTACRLGKNVVLTEESDWLGGQLTSQAVPPDEHAWIESQYVSPSYQRLRQGIRAYYRRNYPLRESVAADPQLNPGLGFVSGLCHEPRVAVAVIDEMLAPHIASGRLRVLRNHVPVAAAIDQDRVTEVSLLGLSGNAISAVGDYFVDATELGDLLELAAVEHVIGAEARDTTGELHASEHADPSDQQAVSWCFAVDHLPGESHVIDRPASFEYWRTRVAPFWPGPQLSWTDLEPGTLATRTRPIFLGDSDRPDLPDLWHFRRLIARSQFIAGAMPSDVTLVNWPQIDYWERPLLGVDHSSRIEALAASRELSLSFLYWMQTEAPRDDGATGYPGLRLRGDITDTTDGLAKAVYVRESRRIRAAFTVVEQHIGVAAREGHGSQTFADSVGLGSYRIDLHPSTSDRTYVDIDCHPFQIPLGALIPIRVENLLPANKNIGTTHITNGAYRLHPVEWSIGEAVGAVVAYCLSRQCPPRQVLTDKQDLDDYQHLLTTNLGITLAWPEHIRRSRV